jgi:hypothetical protein
MSLPLVTKVRFNPSCERDVQSENPRDCQHLQNKDKDDIDPKLAAFSQLDSQSLLGILPRLGMSTIALVFPEHWNPTRRVYS